MISTGPFIITALPGEYYGRAPIPETNPKISPRTLIIAFEAL